MLKLLEGLICVSEKAANLARACRSDSKLFELLGKPSFKKKKKTFFTLMSDEKQKKNKSFKVQY